jgi:rare lipoprotein A
MASWYGPGFHGRRTANGEVYNQHALTAAHPTLPMGARAIVTNVNTGQSVEVRINDRGPYKDGRVIDLSYAAARLIGVWGPGIAPVRITVLNADGTLPSEEVLVASAYAVLVATSTDPHEVDVLMGEVSRRYPDAYVSLLSSGLLHYYQVRLGPFRSRSEATRRAREVERDGLQALVVAEQDRRANR